MTVTWFILYLPVSQSPCDSCSKSLLEEVRVKGDCINRDHVIFAELITSETLLDHRKYSTQNGFPFSYYFFSVVPFSHRNRCNCYTKKNIFFCPGLWWQGRYAHLLDVKSGFVLCCTLLEVSKINLIALTLWTHSWLFLCLRSLPFWLEFAFVSTAESDIWYFCCYLK